MNVFVLTAGRTASTTFATACSHIRGFTAGHETRTSRLFDERFAYPADHIEVDNRLAFFLGALDKKYGDSAHYVHLTRDPDKVASSYRKRWYYRGSIVRAFYTNILMADPGTPDEYLKACEFYVETNRRNIESFLKDKTKVFEFRLENAIEDFSRFVEWLGRDCGPEGYRAWEEPMNVNRDYSRESRLVGAVKKLGRTIRAIPDLYLDV